MRERIGSYEDTEGRRQDQGRVYLLVFKEGFICIVFNESRKEEFEDAEERGTKTWRN